MAKITVEEPEREEYALKTLLVGPVVHISDLIGDLPVPPEMPRSPRREPRRGPRIDWYDVGVLTLIGSSAAAAFMSLLMRG